MGDTVALLFEFGSQFAHTFARPTKRGLRVPSCHWLHQAFEIFAQRQVLTHYFLAPSPFSSHTACFLFLPSLQFLYHLSKSLDATYLSHVQPP